MLNVRCSTRRKTASSSIRHNAHLHIDRANLLSPLPEGEAQGEGEGGSTAHATINKQSPRRNQITIFRVLTILLLFICTTTHAADKKKKDHAKMGVSGYGLTGKVELKRTLKAIDVHWKEREFFDANFVEDTALILMSRVRRDGYLKPQVTTDLTLKDGSRVRYVWNEKIDPPLPRNIQVREVNFKINKGVLYRYDKIQFKNMTELSEKEARGFFVEQGVLLPLKRTRVFTPQKLERGLANIAEVLMRRGYEKAQVTTTNLLQNDVSGKVDVTIVTDAGKKTLVRSIRQETYLSSNAAPIEVINIQTNVPFSKLWEQDFSQQLRSTNYHRGYPDTIVEITPAKRETTNGIVEVDLLAKVKIGEQITLRDVRFEGLERTQPSVVKRRVELSKGEPLDRITVEKGRQRLGRLGIFDTVALRYDTVDEHTRDVVYAVKEGKRLNLNLLLGYGSYELLRAGFELEQFNMFGRAHHSRLRAIQSMKATIADYVYTMPELIGEDVDVFFNASYLQREEVSFTREEFGGGGGVRRYLKAIESDFTARYNYEILSAFDTDVNEGPTNATVSAIIFELKHDQRDNPLYPRRGYRIISDLETATEYLGGDVNYWRFETEASYHHPIGEGHWLHFGLSHGVVYALGGAQKDLPFNKRFFPGGDSTVRGFKFGEAAPRDANGEVVGAETYTLGNFEFEQALTEKFSFVAFVDAIGFAKRIAEYPFDEFLVSVGGGLRWRTIIGPVRLEYGYNVLRRDDDPIGTVQFSIGFPF